MLRSTSILVTLPLGSLLGLGLLTGSCVRSPEDRTADGRLIVNYWEKWTGFEGEAMEAVVDDFNASQTRILVKKLTVSQIDRKLMLATAGGNPPDLAGLWSHSVCDFAEKGALTPLNRMLEDAGMTRADYIPVFWDVCEHRGFMWALPTTPATTALHWNKKLFRDAGLDPDRPPQTLAELDAMAEQLTVVSLTRGGERVHIRFPELTEEERKAKQFKIVQVGHLPHEPGWWMPMWTAWFGGELWDGNQTITAASETNVRAFQWFRSHAEKYGVSNLRTFGASFGNFSSPQNPFLGGQVAMVIQGVWMHNFIDKYAPHLDWAAAPFPAVDAEALPMVTLAESDVIVIPKGARHPTEAFEFIRYLQSQPVIEKLNLGQRKFSPLAEVSNGFIEEHPNPFIRTFIALAKSPNAVNVPRLSIWQEFNEELRVAGDQVMALSAEPEEALLRAQARVQWKLDRILRRWELVKDERLKEWADYDAR